LLLVASPNSFGCEGKVKDAIVNVLASEWPLTLKEIYFAVVKQYSLRVSYQAVHKALKQLVEFKVLVKQERRYRLNIEWIRNLKMLGASLEKEYSQSKKEELPSKIRELERLRANAREKGLVTSGCF